MMTMMNFVSHSTQDLYPTFLKVARGLSPESVSYVGIVYNVGAILGGIIMGRYSDQAGRRRAMVTSLVLAIAMIPFWAYSPTIPMLVMGAFMLQFMVQGAWGVVPVHLNELSPPEARGTFPGFTYQLGNLLASANATIQAGLAESHGNNYGMALALIGGCAALAIALLAGFGVERKGVHMGEPVLHKA